MFTVFLAIFAFAEDIKEHPAFQNPEASQKNKLCEAFSQKTELLAAILDHVNGQNIISLFYHWSETIAYYHATKGQISSQENPQEFGGESKQYEIFYALCLLKEEERKQFLKIFKTFYNSIMTCPNTSVSASFFMLCNALDKDNRENYEYIKKRIKNPNNNPFSFWAGFPYENPIEFLDDLKASGEDPLSFALQPDNSFPEHFREALPISSAYIKTNEAAKDRFLISFLQSLITASPTQPDPIE